MGALSYVRMVLWSFLGIRRNAAAETEFTKVRPVALVAVALLLALLFGLGLWGMATLAVHAFGA